MSLLQQIQNEAVDTSADLGAVLRRCKILAARLRSKPLEDWLQWESDGYPENVAVPRYRTWNLEVKGHFSGPFQSGLRNAPVARASIPEDLRETVTVFQCRQSVSSLERTLAEGSKGPLNVPLGDLAIVLGMNVYQHMNCLQVWGEFSRGCLVEALNCVRNRVLDFALAIEKEYPNAGENPGARETFDQARVAQIFNTTIHHGSMNLVGSATNSSVTQSVGSGDLESLSKALKEVGVPATEIHELQEAVRAEPVLKRGGAFGPRVAAWLGEAIKKAATGAWDVSINVAGDVLSKAICSYYGLPT